MQQLGAHHHERIGRVFVAIVSKGVFLGQKLLFLKLDQGAQHQTGFAGLLRIPRLAVEPRLDFLFQRLEKLNSQFRLGHDRRSPISSFGNQINGLG